MNCSGIRCEKVWYYNTAALTYWKNKYLYPLYEEMQTWGSIFKVKNMPKDLQRFIKSCHFVQIICEKQDTSLVQVQGIFSINGYRDFTENVYDISTCIQYTFKLSFSITKMTMNGYI